MNDRRFIELLNLYVDQELTEAEARELEQEIARDPARRQVYTQYCRMQRACVCLFEQQDAPAPQVSSLARAALAEPLAQPEVIRVPMPVPAARSSRGTAWWMWGSGALAAAACVALVAVTSFGPGSASRGSGSPVAVTPPPTVSPVMVADAAPAPALSAGNTAFRPVFVLNLRPTAEQLAQQSAALAADHSSLHWEQELRLRPIRRTPAEVLEFPATSLYGPAPTFVNEVPAAGEPSEMVTFTFQR